MTEDESIEEHYRSVLQYLSRDMGDCLECSICCRFPTVGVTQKEISSIAEHLGIGVGAFRRKYITALQGRQIIKHQEGTEECIFLGPDNKCRIYNARPYPCWTFPFDVQLKEGIVEIRFIETCNVATHFFEGFMQFLKKHYPQTCKQVNKILEADKPKEEGSVHVTFPNVIINQYMFWLMMEDKNDY